MEGGRTRVSGLASPLSRALQFKQWTAPFFMAATNSQAVRRSNRLLCYAPNLTYTERWGFKDAPSALAIMLGLYVFGGPWIMLSPLRTVLRAVGVLPMQATPPTQIQLSTPPTRKLGYSHLPSRLLHAYGLG